MQIHRSAHAGPSSALPNDLLRDRRLSYTALGILLDLLSRPDGWCEDEQDLINSSPRERAEIRRAIKELTKAGYYRVEEVRLPDGTVRSDVHVYDSPQRSASSSAPRPASDAFGRPLG
ncbi:hypothetical protein [Kitasatospora sp. NPDC056531]|uniref:hypothetical protein n=1 Tax=Kitasatospora sp. NPDC056531 TaxID=3345856 RepID=UPI003682287D